MVMVMTIFPGILTAKQQNNLVSKVVNDMPGV